MVDHIKPLALGGTDDDANTRNLCDAHHHAVTGEQFGHANAGAGERGVARSGRPTGADHPWNAVARSPTRGSKV